MRVAWCLREAGARYDVARAAASRSWLTWGRKLDTPTIGCVVVFWRGKRDGWQGHVGFYAGRAKNGDILVLGGNQGDAVSIEPYSASQFLGYRWPSDAALPPDVEPLAKSGVVQGTSIAVASGGAVLAESLPTLVAELERADRHVQAGTIFGIAIGLLIVAGGGYALWKREGRASVERGGGLMGWLLALPWLRRLGMYAAATGAFVAALVALRRSGERTGRLRKKKSGRRRFSSPNHQRNLH